MHCLPSDPNFAKEAIELGCYIGIAGPVTFQNAAKLREIVSTLPLEQILLETDSPYLTPHPHRGKRNEPCYLSLIVTAIATILNKPVETVISITTSNAKRLFNLP